MKKSISIRQLTQRKPPPSVYLSSRPHLSPVLTDIARSLSHSNVTLRAAQSDDPETAYLTIYESDVFVFYLTRDTFQQLFALYELGAAVVFGKPVIMIREAKLSQLLIPAHFYETDILVHRGAGSPLRRRKAILLAKRIKSRLSLGDVLVSGHKNAVILSSDDSSTCVDELLNRVVVSLRRLRTTVDCSVALRDLQTSSMKPGVKLKSMRNHERQSSKEISRRSLKRPSVDAAHFLCTQTNYMTNNQADEHMPRRPIIVAFPGNTDSERPRKDDATNEESEQGVSQHTTYDTIALDTTVSISTITPLPNQIAPQNVYYPKALPANPMDLSFPPFKIEDLEFNKHAIAIARSDRLPGLVRRRVMPRRNSNYSSNGKK